MDDDSLIRNFEAGTLSADQWHHREHVRMSYLLLMRFPLEVAIDRMRAGLQALNRAHGVPDVPHRGYHETLTQAWMRLVDFSICQHGPAATSEQFLEQHPELGHSSTIRLFYSQPRIRSAEAKFRFVAPDLNPLTPAGQAPSLSLRNWWPTAGGRTGVRRFDIRVLIPIVIAFLIILRGLPGLFFSFGGMLITSTFVAMVGLPFFVAASAIAGRKDDRGWASKRVRNLAIAVYLGLCVVIGILAQIWRGSDIAGIFVPLGIAALLGMPIVVLIWLFTRPNVPRMSAKKAAIEKSVPHPLD